MAFIDCMFVRALLLAKHGPGVPMLVPGRREDTRAGDAFVFRDTALRYPQLHSGLPEGSLYVAGSYEQIAVGPAARYR